MVVTYESLEAQWDSFVRRIGPGRACALTYDDLNEWQRMYVNMRHARGLDIQMDKLPVNAHDTSEAGLQRLLEYLMWSP